MVGQEPLFVWVVISGLLLFERLGFIPISHFQIIIIKTTIAMYQLLKTLLFFVILSIALTSCKSSEKDESITKVEVENSKPSTFKLSDLGTIDIDYIPLETKKESLITKISNFISDGNDFYV